MSNSTVKKEVISKRSRRVADRLSKKEQLKLQDITRGYGRMKLAADIIGTYPNDLYRAQSGKSILDWKIELIREKLLS